MKTFKNRKAEYHYFLGQTLEAGIVLTGSEIKSIRAGKINFKDSYARIESGEVWLYNLHISGYEYAGHFDHDPERKRKLLFNRHEINRLATKVEEKGYTLVPVELIINDKGLVKIIIALARGKRKFDKRDDIRKKTELRDKEREIKDYSH
ncbi:MAG: SsrA-binding protein SmpB [Candidatus Cloacimonetes bacterium]|nr:SsrA-binding protein SmpB [Candidatus Cloacimonadota bacterium]